MLQISEAALQKEITQNKQVVT